MKEILFVLNNNLIGKNLAVSRVVSVVDDHEYLSILKEGTVIDYIISSPSVITGEEKIISVRSISSTQRTIKYCGEADFVIYMEALSAYDSKNTIHVTTI